MPYATREMPNFSKRDEVGVVAKLLERGVQ
jgi:hypothetical protein